MKPWEETWTAQPNGDMVLDADGFELGVGSDYAHMHFSKGREHLVAAAPELYRALEALLDETGMREHTANEVVERCLAALAKARGE